MDPAWRTHGIDFEGFAERRVHQPWLLTNGTGAYAASTAPAINTSRYHGLLIAATAPPVGRIAALNQVWDRLVIRRRQDDTPVDQVVDLATLQFRGEDGQTCLAPSGCYMLQGFERGPSVRWTWQFGQIEIVRELTLHWKRQAITLTYQVRGLERLGAKATLRLSPMLTLRDFHALTHEHVGDPFRVEADGGTLWVRRGGLAVTCHVPRASFEPNAHWWRAVYYPADHERGQEHREDYFVPGALVTRLTRTGQVTFTCALGDAAARPRTAAPRITRLKKIADRLGGSKLDDRQAKLFALAADDFVVERTVGGRKLSTILAGYPWFADWGRDTFIALPGLLLCTGRFAEARRVLRAFADCLRDGLVPNRFDDYRADPGSAHYNTADASLWFVHAAFEYLEKSGDRTSWNSFLRRAVTQIVEAYAEGTRADDGSPIGADPDDGLIAAGHARSQLTWMDAACGGTVFTPRFGKAVEINALWYNALVRLGRKLREGRRYERLAERVREHFEPRFWNPFTGGLYDHIAVDEHGMVVCDEAIRPNQIFAVSLPHSPLSEAKQRSVLEQVRDRLLVPMGLRTLPPDDPHFHPRYTGDQYQRDEAYHQGTVWPWLIGPYAEAVLRAHRFSDDARRRARGALAPLLAQLAGGEDERPRSLGQLHEIHEAEPPDDTARPVGCFAQAWSVAELLRVTQLLES